MRLLLYVTGAVLPVLSLDQSNSFARFGLAQCSPWQKRGKQKRNIIDREGRPKMPTLAHVPFEFPESRTEQNLRYPFRHTFYGSLKSKSIPQQKAARAHLRELIIIL